MFLVYCVVLQSTPSSLNRDVVPTLPHLDFSIYDPELEVIDPSGVHLHGVKNYESAFSLLHAMIGLFYCPDQSGLTFRMCFDKARQNIRIHWNAQVIPKAIFGGIKTTLHVDGISVYEISRASGNITQHRIERLIINDYPIAPENGVFAAMRGVAVKSEVKGIPVFNLDVPNFYDCDSRSGPGDSSTSSNSGSSSLHIVPFQNFRPTTRSVLFGHVQDDDLSSTRPQHQSTTAMESSSSSFDGNNIDWDALERKNLARKKFGLKPLSPEEFMELQKEVQELDVQQKEKATVAAAEMAEKKHKEENPGFLKKLFGDAMKDTCDSNFDCERPQVCCDFGFKKMCCSSGMLILEGPPRSRQGQLAEIPVIANPGPYPPEYDRGDRYY